MKNDAAKLERAKKVADSTESRGKFFNNDFKDFVNTPEENPPNNKNNTQRGFGNQQRFGSQRQQGEQRQQVRGGQDQRQQWRGGQEQQRQSRGGQDQRQQQQQQGQGFRRPATQTAR